MKLSKFAQIMTALTFFTLFATTAAAGDAARGEYRDFSKMIPDATMEFDVKSFKLLVGGSLGSGTLHYQGKIYPLEVKALSAGGIGYREVRGTGKVYGLKNVEDFSGTYGGGVLSGTAGKAGAGGATFENTKNVVLQIQLLESSGLQLAASLTGVEIEFAE